MGNKMSKLTMQSIYTAVEDCDCGNTKYGFDCTCAWTRASKGRAKEFSCEYCGIYAAAQARCNKCEEEVEYAE